LRKWGATGGNTDDLSEEESEDEFGNRSLFTGDHMCVQCDFCTKWRHLDTDVHETRDLSKYTCPSTVYKDTQDPVGLSCEEPAQNSDPPNPDDPYASESYATIQEAVEIFVIRTVEHPIMPLDPAGYPAEPEYRKWLKPTVEEFMTDSYYEYLGYIGRIHPEGTVH
jgi:hypothetical protein